VGLRRPASPLHILARLPFMAGAAREADGIIVGRQAFDPSADDRGYITVETENEISRARIRTALEANDLAPISFPAMAEEKVARGRVVQYQLVETAAWVAADDLRLRRLAAALGGAGVRSLGGYAQPLTPAVSKRK
jgi:hypothetical protein